MYLSGFEQATLGFLAGHIVRLAARIVDYLCFRLLPYSEVSGDAWDVWKHVAIQRIKFDSINTMDHPSPFSEPGSSCICLIFATDRKTIVKTKQH